MHQRHFSNHAIERMSQRHIPDQDRANVRFNNLERTIVLIASGTGTEVVTVYRNRHGTKKIRAKAKFNRKNSYSIQLPAGKQ